MIEELQSIPKLEAVYHVLTITMVSVSVAWAAIAAPYVIYRAFVLRRNRNAGKAHKGSVFEWEVQNGYRLSDGKPMPPPVRSVRECDEHRGE